MSIPNLAKLFCFVFLIGAHCAIAQNEGSIWYLGAGQGLDFSHTPTSGIPIGGFSTTVGNEEGYATLTENGKVIFLSDGAFVGYPYGAAVENGYYLYGTRERQVIIKKPGSTSKYYIFYVASLSWDKRKDLMYCVVDVQTNGTIVVLEKNKLLYEGFHGYFTISAGCKGKDYWLVSEADRNIADGTDKIFSFQIDSVGISEKVVSSPIQMTESGAYRFSPDGTKLFFHFSGNELQGTALADFDRTSGIVSNVTVIGPCCGFGEFASDGRMLYVNYSANDQINLIQYDLSQTTSPPIGTSIATIPYRGKRLQIARDEKIYIVLIDKDTICTLGVVNNPNQTAANCDFQIYNPFWSIPHPNWILVLPEFSTNVFYKSPYSPANAGEDKEVCVGDKISIGGINASNQHFQWSPNQYIVNPKVAQTDFVFNEPTSTQLTFQYILKGLGDECVKADTMNVVVNPRPNPAIYGSRSVCPGVNSVLYSTHYDPTYSYDWSIDGGNIVSSNNTDSIYVDWGVTNPNAIINLSVNNEFNCVSNPVTLPVHINIKLETQTPEGLTHVCDNLLLNNEYQIENTNGSFYTWGILGGEIERGQGTNKPNVNWFSSDLHQIWVIEKSTTKDTVCFGVSDTLNIKVYKDSLQVAINQVSLHQTDENKSTVVGTIWNLPLNFSTPVTLLRRDQSETEWLPLKELAVPQNQKLQFNDNSLQTDNLIYEYQLRTINGCQIEVSSNVHNTIRIEASAIEKGDRISLKWNPYEGWPENVLRYEIWRKIDTENEFSLAGSTDQLTLDLLDGAKGFKHSFIINAISKNDTLNSWSNQTEVRFTHPLIIPNVFTPTGDQYNETFIIHHIELYADNELIIYNRYGEEVYRKRTYDNTWAGEDLSQGIYYYQLRILSSENPDTYKGWVHIMR